MMFYFFAICYCKWKDKTVILKCVENNNFREQREITSNAQNIFFFSYVKKMCDTIAKTQKITLERRLNMQRVITQK